MLQTTPTLPAEAEQPGSAASSGRFPKVIVDWARDIIAKEERRIAMIRRDETVLAKIEANTLEVFDELGIPEGKYPIPYEAAQLFMLSRELNVPVTRFVAGIEPIATLTAHTPSRTPWETPSREVRRRPGATDHLKDYDG